MELKDIDGVSVIIENRWKIFAFLAFFIMFLALVKILLPLADGIVLGLVFAYICRPIYNKMNRKNHYGAFIATMFIVTPLVIIIGTGFIEIFRQLIWVLENQSQVLEIIFDFVRAIVPGTYFERINQLVWESSLSILSFAGSLGFVSYAKSLGMFMINLVVAIFVCYFLLLEGEKLYTSTVCIAPKGTQLNAGRYLRELDRILSGIFIGNAYAALTVSTISVIVFYAFGLSHIPALATLIFIASVIPLFAGYMVLLALSVIRYIEMGAEAAIVFFVVSSIVIYVPPELFLRPYFVSMKSQIHPVVLVVVFLGGGFVGGIAGFFAAPVLLGALVAAYRVYIDNSNSQDTEDSGNDLDEACLKNDSI